VTLGRASQEVMRRKITGGSDAIIEHWTQCRQRSCRDAMHWGASVDARLAKIMPGRNARFAEKERLNAAKNNFFRQRSTVLRIGRNGAKIVPGRNADSVGK